MTLPNTYIRSLLTYPWMELGGRSTISCSQSGYSAVIDFQSKVGACQVMYERIEGQILMALMEAFLPRHLNKQDTLNILFVL